MIKRPKFLPLALLLCTVLLHAVGSANAVSAKPNIVFILADDLGWADTTLYGQTKYYRTPNIDRLATRGMTFTRAYAASPLCSPTRSSILTGLSPARIGITLPMCHLPNVVLQATTGINAPPGEKAVPPKTVTRLDTTFFTLAEALKQAGYATGHFGKWHLGPEPYSPLQQGFNVDIPHWSGAGPAGSYVAPWNFPDFDHDPGMPNQHIEDRMASEAVTFMEKNKSRPFFLNYWMFSVHAPFDAKQGLIDKYTATVDPEDPQRCPVYAAMVESMDDAVGTLIDTLDRLNLTDNTIIIFTSDNGGNMYNTVDGVPPTSNAPLRGGKACLLEGGVRVPCIVSIPGTVAPGVRNDTIIQSSDFYPTLLDLLALNPQPGQTFDGISIVPALHGQPLDRRAIFSYFPHSNPVPDWIPPAVSATENEWKLIRLFFQGDNGAHRYLLYNLKDDLSETNNLADMEPQRVMEMDAMIERFLVDTEAVLPIPNPKFDPAQYHPELEGIRPPGYNEDAIIYASKATGLLMDSSKWNPVAIPVDGDLNEWLINNATHIRTVGADTLFYGQTLTLQNGTLRPSTATIVSTLTMNNMVLTGGTIKPHLGADLKSSNNFIIDFSQHESAGTFMLTRGIIKTETNALSLVTFRNGVLAGNGTITISAAPGSAPTSRVVFGDTISTVGFAGVFDVTSGGSLELPTISAANASFGLTINGGKLYNTADIAVTDLILGTNSIACGTYTAAELVGMNAAYANYFTFPDSTTNTITVVYTSKATGSLMDSNNWSPAAVPVNGDTHEWLINDASQTRTATAGAPLFYGQTLTVQAGILRHQLAANGTLTLNNLVLNGGTIKSHGASGVSGNFIVDLSQDGSAGTFTLNSGVIKTETNATSQVTFRNGVLAGSGTIMIVAPVGYTSTSRVVFKSTMNTVGFTGVFNVTSGSLELPTITTAKASFGLKINGGKLYNNTHIAVTNLVLGTTSIPAGTYTAAGLVAMNATYANRFTFPASTSNTITVVASPSQVAENPFLAWSSSYNLASEISKMDDSDGDGAVNLVEYALGGNPTNKIDVGHKPMLSLGSSGINYVHVERNGTNSGITYVVEVSDSLIAPNWTTSGIQIVSGPLDSEFNIVTNRISPVIKTNQFIRLNIKY